MSNQVMGHVFQPKSTSDVQEAVQHLLDEGQTAQIHGLGSKEGLGYPMTTDCSFQLSDFAGVIDYQPEELILTLKPGTTIAEIEQLLEDQNQYLAFDVPDYSHLYGLNQQDQSIGGAIACNLSGPGRIKMGAARDYILGIESVSGYGDIYRSGGKVVKNVTGYDLSKLLTGAYGTLGIITEITLKVLPKPETQTTLLYAGLDDDAAIKLMCNMMGTSAEVSAAAHLPGKTPITAFRIDGFKPSVETRCDQLIKQFSEVDRPELISENQSQIFWDVIKNVTPFSDNKSAVWRISVPPKEGANCVSEIKKTIEADVYYDWSGGLIWLSTDDRDIAGADVIRSSVDCHGGHATLIRASQEVKENVSLFHPQSESLFNITRAIKKQFDPKGIFNPGKMWREV